MFRYFLKTKMVLIIYLMLYTSLSLAVDRKFQSKHLPEIAKKDGVSPSMAEIQQIGNRLLNTLSNSQSKQNSKSQFSQTPGSLNQKLLSLNQMTISPGAGNLFIHWNDKNFTPTHLSFELEKTGMRKQGAPLSAKATAIDFFKTHASLFRLENPERELLISDEIIDSMGKTHLKFRQQFAGIPVWGHDIVTHLDEYNRIYSINARYSPTPKSIDVNKFNISSPEAVQIARSDLEKTGKVQELPDWVKSICNYQEPEAQKYIWFDTKNQRPCLVWHVRIRPNIQDNWYYFVDAQEGNIVEKYNATNFDGPATAQATDLNSITRTVHSYKVGNSYYMIDASRPIWQTTQPDIVGDPRGALVTIDVRNHDINQDVHLYHVMSDNNTWPDPASVSAHSNMGIVFEYFYNTHGRLAIDNNGSTVISLIHVTKNGQSMDNAYWNGALMLYGDGLQLYKSLAGGLDVAAHEMAHGVTQHTVGLEYKFQSGALNESLSDVFGAMVDREDWQVGEDVAKTTYYPSGTLRDMENPHNGGTNINNLGWQPANMNEYVDLDISEDNGGVHVNSGIPNRACYLIGSSIGKDKTEKIYYRILDARYLNTQSNFVDMRLAAIQAAKDLYGESSPEVNAVISAFDAVGIGGSGGAQPTPDTPPVSGEEWIAAIDWLSGALYLVRPVIQDPETDIVLLTTTPVSVETGNPVSVTDNGSEIIFVDREHNLRAINSDGSGEQPISSDGVWNSISLSPDGLKLAATTTLVDSSIYIFDLSGNNNHKRVRLYSPTTQENVRDYTTILADAMDWNLSSEYLIFDSYTRIPRAGGGNLEYWSINVLNPATEMISMLFPPQPEGVSIGNPSFGQTNDIYFVFDYIDINQGVTQVRSANLFSGNISIIENNDGSVGYPRYSPDDRKLVFQRWQAINDNEFPTLRQIALKESKTEADGVSAEYVTEGMLPAWFAIGSRPTHVELTDQDVPVKFFLSQNYPNPFNPKTIITYQLPVKSEVNLSIYNILGQRITTLVNKNQQAGSYQLEWDASGMASGIYYYHLKAGKFDEVKKMILIK